MRLQKTIGVLQTLMGQAGFSHKILKKYVMHIDEKREAIHEIIAGYKFPVLSVI